MKVHELFPDARADCLQRCPQLNNAACYFKTLSERQDQLEAIGMSDNPVHELHKETVAGEPSRTEETTPERNKLARVGISYQLEQLDKKKLALFRRAHTTAAGCLIGPIQATSNTVSTRQTFNGCGSPNREIGLDGTEPVYCTIEARHGVVAKLQGLLQRRRHVILD